MFLSLFSRLAGKRAFLSRHPRALSQLAGILLLFVASPAGALPVPGSWDSSFRPTFPDALGEVERLFRAPDGVVYAGGVNLAALGGMKRSLVRFSPDGTLDTTWHAGGNSSIGVPIAMALDNEGRLLVSTRIYDPVLQRTGFRMRRLTATGAVDTTFAGIVIGNDSTDPINAIAVQPDGRIVIGGAFHRINNVPTTPLTRLNPDGTLDSTFRVEESTATINALALQSDGKIVVTAGFGRVWRFLSTGKSDTAFNTNSGTVSGLGGRSMVIDSDGSILVAGPKLHRLLADGSPDPAFQVPTVTMEIRKIAVDREGKIVVHAEGSVNGVFSPLVRLLPNGALDPAFVPASIGNGVADMALARGGDIYLGGYFTEVAGESQRYLARFSSGTPAILFTSPVEHRVTERVDGQFGVAVMRYGNVDIPASVRVTTQDGTAVAGDDFVALDQRVEFAAGEGMKFLYGSLIDDSVPERRKSFSAKLSEPSDNAVLNQFAVSDFEMVDNDPFLVAESAKTYALVFELPGSDQKARLVVTLARSGVVTGKLTIGSRRLSAVGRLNPDGDLLLKFPGKAGLPALQLALHLEQTAGSYQLAGTISDGASSQDLEVPQLATFPASQPTPFAGRYTVALPAGGEGAVPRGWGWLTLQVKPSGAVLANGRFADGTPVVIPARLTSDGEVQLYATPSRGKTLFAADLNFSPAPTVDVAGNFTLVNLGKGAAGEGAFQFSGDILGSAVPADWMAPESGSLLCDRNAPAESLHLEYQHQKRSQYLISSGKGSFSVKANGAWSGKVITPEAPRAMKMSGVWLPDENRGFGFLGKGEGALELTDWTGPAVK